MKTVKTTIRLLREFSVEEPELGVRELARRLDLDKATVHRMLSSLAAERVVEQDPVSKRYRLGFAVIDLAASRMQSFHFLAKAVDEIHALRDRIGESVGIHVLDDHEMICLDFAEASQPVRVAFWVGERSPVHLTATGLASLSTMDRKDWLPIVNRSVAAYSSLPALSDGKAGTILSQARKNGFAIADETYEKGVRAIAVPVCDASGAIAFTLCIAAPAQRRTVANLREWAPELTAAGQRIRRTMVGMLESAVVQRLGLAGISRKQRIF